MGDSSSKLEAEKKKGAAVIACGSHISVHDINTELSKRPNLSESSKKIFRAAANLVAESDDYIFRDCELVLVNGNELYIIFYAGSLGNKYLVMMNDSSEAESRCKQRSMQKVFWDGAFAVYTSAKEILAKALHAVAVDALQVAVKKAIKYK